MAADESPSTDPTPPFSAEAGSPCEAPSRPDRYDLVVVGDGPAAGAAAEEGAARGYRVAVVTSGVSSDPSPTEAWVVSHVLRQAAGAARQTGAPEFRALLDWARDVCRQSAAARSLDRLTDAGVDLYPGPPVFTGPNALCWAEGQLVFRRAVLALEGQPGPLTIDGAEQSGCLTGEDLLGLNARPERLVILGVGPWECQWAQIFRRLGSEVHLIGAAPRILPDEPFEAAMIVQQQFEQERISLLLDCRTLAVERTGAQRAVVFERGGSKEKLFADQILLQRPRQVELHGLNLDAAGVAVSERGMVVDRRWGTTSRRIFTAGPLCGQEFCAPEIAEALARHRVAKALAWWPRRQDRPAVVHCVWTDPQLVRFGQTEAELAQDTVAIDAYRAELAEIDQAVLERREIGYSMVYVRRATGRIVGGCLVAEEASELVSPLLLLSAYGLPLSALGDVVACHPSRFELLARIADRYRQGPGPSLGLLLKEAWHRWRSRNHSRTA